MRWVSSFCLLLIPIIAQADEANPPANTPEESLRCLKARSGFEIELVAAEPLVQSPIAMAWGPDGKLWVVEMTDYPLGSDSKGKPGGRIKCLESTKGDGKYDKSTVFVEGLSYPTGVMAWGKGIIVSCAPEIFYAEDTKGTGKADKRVTLYSGFGEGNPQHRVNGFTPGLDNWLYAANGDSGGKIKSAKTGAVLDIGGRDFRIRPATGAIDNQTGVTQYGRNQDDWGNWFGSRAHRLPFHFVLDDHYLRRSPHLAAPDPRTHIGVATEVPRVYPISKPLPRFNYPAHMNHLTSGCSAIIYRDELFGPEFAGNLFMCEPAHNLVHREMVQPAGVTFKCSRAPGEENSEFLASTDNWFRPCQVQTGPDGALWVADMYRLVIEHPQWIPPEWQKKLDLRAGHDKGRIYLVYPTGKKPRAIPRLDKLGSIELVAALDSPNGWQRDMAQMLLIRKQDKGSFTPLVKLTEHSHRPQAILHAMCALDGLGELRPELIRKMLAHEHPGIRRHAVRLSETRLGAPNLGNDLVKLLNDPDPQVRMQLAYTLGSWDSPEAGKALAQLAIQNSDDTYLVAAALSSVNQKNLGAVVNSALDRAEEPSAQIMENLLRMSSAFNDQKSLTALLANLVVRPKDGKFAVWRLEALAGWLDGLDQRNSSLVKLRDESGRETKQAIEKLAEMLTMARASIADSKAPRAEQLQAVRLLGRGLEHQEDDLNTLQGLLVPQTPSDLQSAAIAALGKSRNPKVPEILLRGWKAYGPGLRSQVLDVLFRRDDWLIKVLDAIDEKTVLAHELDASRRQRLLNHPNKDMKARAVKSLAGSINADRQKVIDSYQAVHTVKGDADRGKAVFTKVCAACHLFGGIGHAIGPDLGAVGDKTPQGLLVAILDPNRAVEPSYVEYLALLKNGQTISGKLEGETGTSITIATPESKKVTILRTELEELVSTGKSVMPEGLEKDLKPQDVADVIAFVRGPAPGPQPKALEGNKPELVKPAADGSLHLLASNCAVFGTTLVIEKKHGNLGFWNSEDDRAVWTLEIPKQGKYAIWMDWSCHDRAAGNAYTLDIAGKRIDDKVKGTGTWQDYKQVQIAELDLPAGRHEAVIRSNGKINRAMIDLKSLKLVPAKKE